jgi:glycosyltransferase involved in cell wall biosynthesis
MQYGLPVLARVNAGTDLQRMIEDNAVGRVYVGSSVNELKRLAEELADNDDLRKSMSERGRKLGRSMFSPEIATQQILASAEQSFVDASTAGEPAQPGMSRAG